MRAAIFGGVLTILAWVFLRATSREFQGEVALVAMSATIVGLGVALTQIARLRASTDAALDAARDAQSSLGLASALQRGTDAERLTEVVKLAAESRNYNLAELRLSELRDLMIRLNETVVPDVTTEPPFEAKFIEELREHRRSLTDVIASRKNAQANYTPDRLIEFLELTRIKVLTLNSHIEKKSNERNLPRR